MRIPALREEVLEANLEIVRRGLVLYTFGNASGFDPAEGLVAIKPSGVPFEKLRPEDMAVTDLDGRIVEARCGPHRTSTRISKSTAFPRRARRGAHALDLRHGLRAGAAGDSLPRHDARRLFPRARAGDRTSY